MITLDEISVGTNVNVKWTKGDMFDHDFTGYVVGIRLDDECGTLVMVEDQDGIAWDVELWQLSFSSDDIVHGD
jgi:hypothetical protein